MLCPKCGLETTIKREYTDPLGVVCRRRRCKRGHWFDTRQIAVIERLTGDVVSIRVLILKQKIRSFLEEIR